ncbi:MAG: radical SAM family heme chaperone HemW [Marinilabiliaceae bacterium]|nr:radical SAM family heme chaperone HemW [Marinilabiliaceae bacterium]
MAGIYIHVPFCKKRCNYCDFYKSTHLELKTKFLNALNIEIIKRFNVFNNNEINSIYFGGGTPSVLNIVELNKIFSCLYNHFKISGNVEITFECNPDDFSNEYAKMLFNETPVNRLSFGIQSIDNNTLQMMGRRHTASDGILAVERADKVGFKNITADLIYGLPGLGLVMWGKTLDVILNLPIKHLSAYHLTFEKGTLFYDNLQNGLIDEIDDNVSLDQFQLLVEKTQLKNFNHYEISNFALPGYESFHNSNYWTGEPYIGLGPSAHSFYNDIRQWNVSDVNVYIKKIINGECFFESELLSSTDRYNELLMLGLRTSKGLSVNDIKKIDYKYYQFFINQIEELIKSGKIINEGDYYKISPSFKFVSDGIIEKLFLV